MVSVPNLFALLNGDVDAALLDEDFAVLVAAINSFVPTSGVLPDDNLYLNSGMIFDQRHEGAAVAFATGTTAFTCDQFLGSYVGAATGITMQQVTDAPPGFTNSLKITIGTGSAVLNVGDHLQIEQNLEGINAGSLAFGGANASPLSLGFWVKTSSAGIYSLSIRNSAIDRSSVYPFSISQNNVWSFISLPALAGDVTGTWLTGINTIGVRIGITLMCSASLQATQGWSAGNFIGATGMANMAANTGATFQLTGIKLQQGSAVSQYLPRNYTSEHQRLQRYYWKTFLPGTAPVQAAGLGTGEMTWQLPAAGATFRAQGVFPVMMCKQPTLVGYNPNAANANAMNEGSGVTIALGQQNVTARGFQLSGVSDAGATAGQYAGVHLTAEAGL